eukprot:1651886-Ditylum_brightwellii.AAC.1
MVEIHALTGEIMTEQAMKANINAEDMANMWRKISFTDKGKRDNNITLILILASLEDPKKAQQWRTLLHNLKPTLLQPS